jgi:hypothetical protein
MTKDVLEAQRGGLLKNEEQDRNEDLTIKITS